MANGHKVTPTMVTGMSAYIQQDDMFIGTMTVKEQLSFQGRDSPNHTTRNTTIIPNAFNTRVYHGNILVSRSKEIRTANLRFTNSYYKNTTNPL
jgi:hypothetical protein